MITLKKILVPVDLDELSMFALDEAFEVARAFDAKVVALHVYEYSLWGLDGGPDSPVDAARRIRQAAGAELAALVDAYKARGLALESLLREGIAWSEIVTIARDEAYDMIVIGTHGRKGLPRAILGSVAEKVVRYSTVPVLTVRPAEKDVVASSPRREGPLESLGER